MFLYGSTTIFCLLACVASSSSLSEQEEQDGVCLGWGGGRSRGEVDLTCVFFSSSFFLFFFFAICVSSTTMLLLMVLVCYTALDSSSEAISR